jgi:hypothetical protein
MFPGYPETGAMLPRCCCLRKHVDREFAETTVTAETAETAEKEKNETKDWRLSRGAIGR